MPGRGQKLCAPVEKCGSHWSRFQRLSLGRSFRLPPAMLILLFSLRGSLEGSSVGVGQHLPGAWMESFFYLLCPKFLALCWVSEAHFLVFPLMPTAQ